MKALMLNNKVVDISESAFPVSSELSWLSCDETVKVGYIYEDGEFFNPYIIDEELRAKQDRIEELKIKLSKTDYMMLPDYQERTTRTAEELELVKQERLAWYTELKNLEM